MSGGTGDLLRQGIQLERSGEGASKMLDAFNKPGDAQSESTETDTTIYASGLDSTTVDTTDQDTVEKAKEDTETSDPRASKDTEAKPQDATKRTVAITDHKGKREITVDLNDHDKTIKAYQMAAGMRKFQQERDTANQKLGTAEKELTDHKTRFEKLEQIYREHGEDGIIRLLSDGKRNLDSVVHERATNAERRAKADPAELAKMDLDEVGAKSSSEIAKLTAKIRDLESNITSNMTAAETQKMESVVHPAFDKYRFSGKLGSPEDEAMFDEMMWGRATRVLDSYREQGIALTPDLVEKEFKKQSVAMSRLVKTQVDTKVSQVIEDKKAKTLETVQRQATRGMQVNKEQKKAHDMLTSGNISGFFKSFGGKR